MEQQRPLQSPVVTNNMPEPVMSIGNWIVTFILLVIPIVNIIMLIIWALSNSVNRNRKSFAIAVLIIWVILFIIGLIASPAITAWMSNLAENANFNSYI
jgi:type II secretory pathway component PulF